MIKELIGAKTLEEDTNKNLRSKISPKTKQLSTRLCSSKTKIEVAAI